MGMALGAGALASRMSAALGLAARIRICGALVLIATLAAASASQSMIYKNEETLWRDTIRLNPGGWMPKLNLAKHLTRAERYEEALDLYYEALMIDPMLEPVQYHEGQMKVIEALRVRGRDERIVKLCERILEVGPRHSEIERELMEARGRMEKRIQERMGERD
jgi:tetratricopeptide (TPR) repeat protein